MSSQLNLQTSERSNACSSAINMGRKITNAKNNPKNMWDTINKLTNKKLRQLRSRSLKYQTKMLRKIHMR